MIKKMSLILAGLVMFTGAAFCQTTLVTNFTTPAGTVVNNGAPSYLTVDTQDGVPVFGSVHVLYPVSIFLPNDPANPGSPLNLAGTLTSYAKQNEVPGHECNHIADVSFTAYYVLDLGQNYDQNGNVYNVKATLSVPFKWYNCGSAGRGGNEFPRYITGEGTGVVTETLE